MNNSSFATLLSTIMAACAAMFGLTGIVYWIRERKSHV